MDRQTDRQTNQLIESIGSEGRCFENVPQVRQVKRVKMAKLVKKIKWAEGVKQERKKAK